MLKATIVSQPYVHKCWKMKDVVLINNRSAATGIGNYSYNLYTHLKTMSKRNIDFLTLNSPAEDSYGPALRIFSQKMKRIMDHFRFVRNIPDGYNVYHVLSPNLGMLLSKHRPSVVTVFDIAALIPSVSKDIVTQSYGLDLPILLAVQINMRFLRNADRILCMSQNTKNDLTKVLGLNAKRIVVGYPGIDRTVFCQRDKRKARHDLNLPLNRKVILHVGVDEPRKNIRTLLRAFHLLKRKIPDALLIRIGGMRESTRRLILELGLKDSFIHFRKVDSVAFFYNAADLFVFPSYYEGFGYPVAEAMSSGCPVIAGDSSSIPEVVGKAGILFPPSDVATLYENMCQVLTDNSWRLQMAKEGIEQSLKFDWKPCAQTTLEVYESLYS